MFCKKCGAKLDDDALFCEKCGTTITRQNVEAVAINTTEVLQERTIPEVELSKEIPAPQKLQKNKILAIIGIGVLVIAIGAFCLTRFTGSFGGSKNVYQEINFNNGAHFAYDDTRLYFIADYNADDEDESLYSTDYNGGHKTLIADAENIIRIRVIDGKIYYQESDDGYSIGSMTTAGEENHTIIEFENIAEKYDIANGQLYYLTDSKIYSCNLSGENSRVLMEDARTFVLDGTMMYYATEDGIYSLNLQNEKQAQLCEAEKASNLVIEGKSLYYSVSDDGLYCVSLSGNTVPERIIGDNSLGQFVFQNDGIYYVHEMSDSNRETIANYIADSERDALMYEIALIGCGSIYRCDKTGGGEMEMESDQLFVQTLYTYPDGLYCKSSAFSNSIEKVVFEK